MSVNIISINALIMAFIDKEEHENKEKLKLIADALSNDVNEDLRQKLMILQDSILFDHTKNIFVAQTSLIIDEYTKILRSPISRVSSENTEIIERKNLLVVKYLNIARELINNKQWNIYLPLDPKDSIVCGEIPKTCSECDKESCFEVDEFNRRTCLFCSNQQTIIETGTTHRDYSRVNIVGKFIYNRVLHFQDCIKQYQGKQNCKIPNCVYEDLNRKFKAHRLLISLNDSNTGEHKYLRYSKITRNHISWFLKELKYTKHYENVNLIYFTLTNKRVDDISHLENQLIEDFQKLVDIYDSVHGKDKPDALNRKNFMNVQYLLFQLLRRHDHPCKIEDFTILKTIDRKLFHDTICKKLFDKLGWKFTPIF